MNLTGSLQQRTRALQLPTDAGLFCPTCTETLTSTNQKSSHQLLQHSQLRDIVEKLRQSRAMTHRAPGLHRRISTIASLSCKDPKSRTATCPNKHNPWNADKARKTSWLQQVHGGPVVVPVQRSSAEACLGRLRDPNRALNTPTGFSLYPGKGMTC